jgi:hypothetical protein
MTGSYVLERSDFDALLGALARRGYTIVGPTVRDQAIVYDRISSATDLPIGWTDEQEAGRYRLRRRDDGALFGYAVGPHSWKQYQLPAEVKLWRAARGLASRPGGSRADPGSVRDRCPVRPDRFSSRRRSKSRRPRAPASCMR